jgi:hypothetical protein
MVEMLFEMLGMLVADEPRQRRSDQAAGTAGNGCRRDRAEHRATRRHNRKAANDGRQVDADPYRGTFRIADRLARHKADPRRFGIVLELGGRLVFAPEL